MRRRFDDDEQRPGWFWRFLKGVIFSVVVCGIALALISLYVLPPAELPPPGQASTESAGPTVVDGIEVSSQPAYSGATGADTSAAATPEPEALGPIQLAGPALEVNAVPFEADAETPLVAVVLDDTAADPFLHELLFGVDLPLTVGVIAGGGGDRIIAEKARESGFEVLAEIPIVAPGASNGMILEYGLAEDETARRTDLLMRRVPMAVAVSRPLADGTPPDSAVLVGLSDALMPHGFAYLDHGLQTMEQAPGPSAGMAAPVGASRFAISADAELAAVIAVLDAAAADAAIRGSAIVMAKPSEALIGAMQLWGGEGSVGTAKLAPLSAAIRRQAGG